MDQRCRELAPDPAARLTVIELDGTVLCDSEAVAAQMENHLGRPEVQEALQNGDGQSVRRSATTGQRYMYHAYMQRVGARSRIIRFALPTTAVSEAQSRIRWILLLSLGLAAGVGLWPAVRLSQWLSRRIDAMVTFSQAVAADQDPPRLAPERRDDLGRLEANLSTMGRAVSERLRATREEEQKLRAVLAGMVEGVLVVAERGELVLLNERAREIFGLDAADDYRRPADRRDLPRPGAATTDSRHRPYAGNDGAPGPRDLHRRRVAARAGRERRPGARRRGAARLRARLPRNH